LNKIKFHPYLAYETEKKDTIYKLKAPSQKMKSAGFYYFKPLNGLFYSFGMKPLAPDYKLDFAFNQNKPISWF
jgi:hypothetical protein